MITANNTYARFVRTRAAAASNAPTEIRRPLDDAGIPIRYKAPSIGTRATCSIQTAIPTGISTLAAIMKSAAARNA